MLSPKLLLEQANHASRLKCTSPLQQLSFVQLHLSSIPSAIRITFSHHAQCRTYSCIGHGNGNVSAIGTQRSTRRDVRYFASTCSQETPEPEPEPEVSMTDLGPCPALLSNIGGRPRIGRFFHLSVVQRWVRLIINKCEMDDAMFAIFFHHNKYFDLPRATSPHSSPCQEISTRFYYSSLQVP